MFTFLMQKGRKGYFWIIFSPEFLASNMLNHGLNFTLTTGSKNNFMVLFQTLQMKFLPPKMDVPNSAK